MKTNYGYVNRFAAATGSTGSAGAGGAALFVAFLLFVGAPILWSEIAHPREGHFPFNLLKS